MSRLTGQVHHAQAVLPPRVLGGRVDVVGGAQLPQATQPENILLNISSIYCVGLPIKLRSVNDGSEDWRDLNVSVDVVVDVGGFVVLLLGSPDKFPHVGAPRRLRSGRSRAVDGNIEG